MSQNDIPQTRDPLTVTTLDGTKWVRSGLTRSGRGLYAIEGVTACPDHVMATLNELAEHGIKPLSQPLAPSAENVSPQVQKLRGILAGQRAATDGELAEQRHLVDPLDHALEALAPRTQDGGDPMTLKPITFRLAPGALLGRLSADIVRQTTLLSLVAEWGDEEARENVIAVLDNLAVVASDPVDEAELRRRVLAVECAAEMDPADVSVSLDELLRLRAEMDRVINEIRSTHVLLVGRLG
ncbi:hypothetical protein AB0A76_09200 [Streptomyces exfoliatus]|uniref:Uncharacterized protein n=1 Tax=Streptomyces exfoliatus TaxID=1905 RepID=A0ABV3CU03_STREX